MKTQPTTPQPRGRQRTLRATLTATLLPALLVLLTIHSGQAGSATWNLNPASSDWLDAANWTPATVPNAPGDTATFGTSNTTSIFPSSDVTTGNIIFATGASAYTIDAGSHSLLLQYITNASGVTQTFICSGAASITASVGDLIAWRQTGGFLQFYTIANLGTAAFTIEGGAGVEFGIHANGGDSTLTVSDGSMVTFADHSNAGNATLIMNGGEIQFFIDSDGGTARVELLGTSVLDISPHNAPGMTLGSIEGSGSVFIGANNLTVGSNNLSTTYSGTIHGSAGGSLTKTGNGKLILSKANRYSGGTTISKGQLLVSNRTGSATGTGAVQVRGGTLGGTGTISGAVTIAAGAAPALLAPGNGIKPGTLSIQGGITFDSLAICKLDLNSTTVSADQVVAAGVAINSGAQVSIADLSNGTLSSGAVFTVISNTSATPIAGTFANLADRATTTVGNNTFQANYEGGDGNDLTLTVVP